MDYDALLASGDHIPGDMPMLELMCMSHWVLSWQRLKEQPTLPFYLQGWSMSWSALLIPNWRPPTRWLEAANFMSCADWEIFGDLLRAGRCCWILPSIFLCLPWPQPDISTSFSRYSTRMLI